MESASPEVPVDEEAPNDEGAPLAEAVPTLAALVEPLPLDTLSTELPRLPPPVEPLLVKPPSTAGPPLAALVKPDSSVLPPSALWRLNHSASASASEARPPGDPLPAAVLSR